MQLLPFDGIGSAVPSLQLHRVFGISTEDVPPNDAMSRLIGFGDKNRSHSKNFFQTQGLEFLFFVPKGTAGSLLRLDSAENARFETQPPFSSKPPAVIVSEPTQVACTPFAKQQVTQLRHQQAK